MTTNPLTTMTPPPGVTRAVTPGVIAGASVGGSVVGIGLLFLAWLQAHNLQYFFESLVCPFLL
jgi:hypothetical protein